MNPKIISNRLRDLLDDHPFESTLSFALVLFGIRAFITGLQAAPGSVQILPLALAVSYCFLSVVGGGLVIFGLSTRYIFDWSYGIERAGLFVSASAWLSYIVGILFSPLTGSSTLFVFSLIALSGGCLLRARAINRNAKATLFALRHAKIGDEEHDE